MENEEISIKNEPSEIEIDMELFYKYNICGDYDSLNDE